MWSKFQNDIMIRQNDGQNTTLFENVIEILKKYQRNYTCNGLKINFSNNKDNRHLIKTDSKRLRILCFIVLKTYVKYQNCRVFTALRITILAV